MVAKLLPLFALILLVSAYKPVFLLHGINSSAQSMNTIANTIQQQHPNTTVINLPLYEKDNSILSLDIQVPAIASAIRAQVAKNPALFAQGYHFVCHSQGGLICRCLTQMMDDHLVDTLISLAGPQMGVYDRSYFSFFSKKPMEDLVLDDIYKIAYLRLFQDSLSVGNMWHDPIHETDFLNKNNFLPLFNGLVGDPSSLKKNFVRLNKACFFVGSFPNGTTYDGGIGPWQSGAWAYYKNSSQVIPPENLPVVSLYDQPIYKDDLIGLRTLDEQQKLTVEIVPGIEHSQWVANEDVIKKFIVPNLV